MIADRDYIEIPLGGKKLPGRFALIDREDEALIGKATWRAVTTHRNRGRGDDYQIPEYVSAHNRSGVYENFPKYVYLHRLVMGVVDRRVQVDHINHNGLDCRKSNLRCTTHQENHFNRRPHSGASSRFKGVSWRNRERKWKAQICHNDRITALGLFGSEIEAAIAYDNAAMEVFDEFAYLNFPARKAS